MESQVALLDKHESESDRHLRRVRNESMREERSPDMELSDIPADGAIKPEGRVTVDRRAHDLQSFNEMYGYTPDIRTCAEKMKKCFKGACVCSGKRVANAALGFFPFINVMRGYQWKAWTVSDLIAGISVGLIHVPQGMGFALLTSVPPVYGLYATFFPLILYFIFGTSNHISVGTMAVISLMVGAVVDRETADFVPSNTTSLMANGTLSDDAELVAKKVGIAAAVTFWAGIIQILMGVLRLGVVTTFMPMPFVNGFITGAACHIATSQMKFVFGLTLQRFDGVLTLIYTWIEIFKNIRDTNVAELVIALMCIFILVFLKEFINVKFKDKLPVPLPAELVVVAIGALASYFGKLTEKYGVKIINDIPRGFPTPAVPDFSNSGNFIVDALIVSIVSFAISISLAKIYCKKYKYSVDTNQELLAYGLSHSLSAFFHSFAGAAAPPRCTVHDSTGGKTQVAALWSALMVLLVVVALGFLFEPLPNAVLASIIIVALIPMFKQFNQLPELWKVNKYDFAIWIGTCLAVVVLDVSTGLGVGIGIALLTIPIQTWLSIGQAKTTTDEGDIYLPKEKYQTSAGENGIYIFSFHNNLVFLNVDRFKEQLFKSTTSPAQCAAVKSPEPEEFDDIKVNGNGTHHPGHSKSQTKGIILDCSGMSYIDVMGLGLLKSLAGEYHDVGVSFSLAACNLSLTDRLSLAGIDGKGHHIGIFPTLVDAVTCLKASHDVHQKEIIAKQKENAITANEA